MKIKLASQQNLKDRIYAAVRERQRDIDKSTRPVLKTLNLVRREQVDGLANHLEGLIIRARQVQFRVSALLARLERNR